MWWVGDSDAILDEVETFLASAVGSKASARRALATVMFTDVVGSTERASELGDRRWRDVLDAYHDVARREITRFAGKLIGSSGDGFCATFDMPADAVRCASAIADGVRALELDVRAGVHTGEIEILGADVAGIGVHIAARVMAAAAPGEVLVSRTVADLVTGSGLSFEDRGEHDLKGVPGAWRLYRVA
jgi:class 3 adenylate cyclase